VIGNNLTLTQSIAPNTLYIETENIVLSQNGGFNPPFVISDAVNVNGQNIIRTITGEYSNITAGAYSFDLTQFILNDFYFFTQSTISIEAYVKVFSTPNGAPAGVRESAVEKVYGVFTYKNTYGDGFELCGTTDHNRKDNFSYSVGGLNIDLIVNLGISYSQAYDGIALFLESVGDDYYDYYWDLTMRYRYE
jgi:hypothetical protein